ncbi:alpha-hydroxy acid oxidase [Horticoccus sp. 23ND18S-11]|uniref:alpha-hydroxy acid oxidase n=1 Tax=Horticoccus sp. 23ND18S-11 TaxID=3391832 RepID=UPI0039C95F40
MTITRRGLLRSTGLLAGGTVLSADGVGATPSPAKVVDGPEPADVFDYEQLAPGYMTAMAWEYAAGGAADELTLRWNRESYERMRLRPRVLVDVSQLDTRLTLFGRELPHPILLAPTAYHKLAHAEGEVATAKGAGAAGATFVLSTSATATIEEVAQAATQPLWFQLYVQPDREFTRALVRRAEAAGYRALVVTVDTPVLGPRYRETRAKFTLPPGVERANLRGLNTATGGHRPGEASIYSALLDPRLTWKEIEWLRGETRLPVLLKGILTAEDAARAVEVGAAGIIVSNHGGRNLDTVPATIDALPEVVARAGGRVPVLVDGGIRRGTDILKAIATGATAVLIGRPYVYGLAVGGADGVARVVNILRREFEMAMALTGRTSLSQIDSTVLWR